MRRHNLTSKDTCQWPPAAATWSDLGGMIGEVTQRGLQLAELTVTLVRVHSARWALLADTLRADVALRSMPDSAWEPAPGPAALWGRASNLSWISAIRGFLRSPRIPESRSPRRLDGSIGIHNICTGRCSGSGSHPAIEASLALLVAHQEPADATWAPAQPQDLDGRRRHSGDTGRTAPRPRGPRHANMEKTPSRGRDEVWPSGL